MTSLFEPASEPKTELGRLRILSKHAGIRVSPLALGAMSIGEAWKGFMGSMDKEQSFKLLGEFVDAGGNFVSTISKCTVTPQKFVPGHPTDLVLAWYKLLL